MSETKDEIFNKDLVVKMKQCTTTAEIIAVAKEFNVELTQEQAEIHLHNLNELLGR